MLNIYFSLFLSIYVSSSCAYSAEKFFNLLSNPISMSLRDRGVEDADIKLLSQAEQMKHVTALDAYSNNITEAGIGHIIKGKWKLKELHIAENNLKNGGFLKVINNRYFLNNLIILDVGFNDIEFDECNINILLACSKLKCNTI